MFVAVYLDEGGCLQVIGPFESLEIAGEWAADQDYTFLPLQSPECGAAPIVDSVREHFIDTSLARHMETAGPDECVGRVVGTHPDCAATVIMENEETDTLWYAERSALEPITKDAANAAYLRLAEDNCSAWR